MQIWDLCSVCQHLLWSKIFNFGMASKSDANLYGIYRFTYVVKVRKISMITPGANVNKLNRNLKFFIVVNVFNRNLCSVCWHLLCCKIFNFRMVSELERNTHEIRRLT